MSVDLSRSLVKILFSNAGSDPVGTGTFITTDGHVLTCYHVIEKLQEIWLSWNGQSEPMQGEVCNEWCNPAKDYAILKVSLPEVDKIQLLPFGTAWERGDKIYAKGYQYDYFKVFPAYGFITDTTKKDDHTLLVLEDIMHIQPGISGAPAWNERTKSVIGIIKMKWEETNTGFIVPTKEIVTDLSIRATICKSLSDFLKSVMTLPKHLQEILDYLNNIIGDPKFKDWNRQHYFDLELSSENIIPYDIKMRIKNRQQLPERDTERKYTVNEAIECFGQCVIVGDPGSGKTTALKRMTLRYAEDCLEEIKTQKYLKNKYIPVYIQLSRYSFVGGNTFYEKILFLLIESFQRTKVLLAKERFSLFLRKFKFIFFLDGVNEMPEKDIDSLIEGVYVFNKNHPDHLFVITSRLHNFQFEKYKFPILELLELKYPDNIKEYLECYLQYEDIDIFFRELNLHHRIRKLAVNPMLLYMMIIVFKKGKGKLPNSRGQLFNKIARGMLGEWVNNEEDAKDKNNYSIADKHMLLVSVGYIMKDRGLELPLNEIIEIFQDAVKNRENGNGYKDKPKSNKLLNSNTNFMEVIEELKKNRLLQEINAPHPTQRLRFWHQTIQEYFAAFQIAKECESLFKNKKRNIKKKLNTYIKDPRWHEILAITAGVINDKYQEKLIEFIWKKNSLLAAMCISNTERALPNEKLNRYIERLKMRINWWGLIINRIYPWIIMAILGLGLFCIPTERLDYLYHIVTSFVYTSIKLPKIFLLSSLISVLIICGLFIGIIYFRLLDKFWRMLENFIIIHCLYPDLSSVTYIRTDSAERLLAELRILVNKDFWVGNVVKNTIEAAQAIPIKDEDELILMLKSKENRLQAIERLGEEGSQKAIKPLIEIVKAKDDETVTLFGAIEALLKIGKTLSEADFMEIEICLKREMDNIEKNSYDKRNKIYKTLCEIGIKGIRPPKRTKIIRDYLQGHLLVIGFLILILLLAIFYYHFFY